MQEQAILQLQNIVKIFPGVRAVDDVSFDIRRGEIHALLGHNGAGKSTLVKIISGAYQRDSGEIILDGQAVHFTSPQEALRQGIGMVYQELDLIPWLDGSENIFLGQKRFLNKLGFIDRKARLKEAEALIAHIGVQIDLTVPVWELSISKQQLIAIVKAITRDAKVIILDEPTAALNEAEVKKLFDIMHKLTARGIGIILITHRLGEVFRMADRVTLMRDGKRLSTTDIKDITMQEIVSAMTGVSEEEQQATALVSSAKDKVVVECRDLSSNAFKDISFDIREGEVLGITGLIGCGSTEIAKAMFGAYPVTSGQVRVNGVPLKPQNPGFSVKNGVAYVSEDRKTEGLNLVGSVRYNISITILKELSKLGFIQFDEERKATDNMIGRLQIRTPQPTLPAQNLSGGNQQKVVLAKWLLKESKVFIMCEPTRGIDVGSKREIYRIIRDLAAGGVSVLVVSSEIEEIMDTCDRILILYEGKISLETQPDKIKKADMMNLMYGVS